MILNRYGILIEQFIKEEYPIKYKKLLENGTLYDKIKVKQDEMMKYRYILIQEIAKNQRIDDIKYESIIEKQMNEKLDEIFKDLPNFIN